MGLAWLHIFKKKILLSRWPKSKRMLSLNISCCFMTLIAFRSPTFPLLHRVTIYSLDVLLFLFGTCLLFHVQFFFFFFLTLQNCISFAKYQNEPATGIHVFPVLNPPPNSLAITYITAGSSMIHLPEYWK